MSSIKINDKVITLRGNLESPRFLWIVDRVCRQIDDMTKFGLNENDQVAIFDRGSFDNVTEFLRQKAAGCPGLSAVIFFFMGGDEIAIDAPALVEPAWEKYFHVRGPRQIPLKAEGEVLDGYIKLVDAAVSLFPAASVFSTDPPPRRSGGGFATARAIYVSSKITRRSPRHHHSSQIRRFHGRRRGNGHLHSQGGLKPVNDEMFESDGIQFCRAALIGAIVRQNTFVEAILAIEGQLADPACIEGLKMRF